MKKKKKNPAPDLWIIDGGETLLKLAYDIVQSVGVNLDIIAIAKEKLDAKLIEQKGATKDIIHYKDKNGEFKNFNLSTSDKRLQFVQRQRDEAHRFAITFPKTKKELKINKSLYYKSKELVKQKSKTSFIFW